MAKQDGGTTTSSGRTSPQTGDLIDNKVDLDNQDMINNGENMTNNAALDNDAINTNNAMDNAATNVSPHQDLPLRNRQHIPAPDRQVQQSQSTAAVVQRNPIQNPQEPPPKQIALTAR